MSKISVVAAENAVIRLQGIEQLFTRMSATENSLDNEMFVSLGDMIKSVREDLEAAIQVC